MARELAMDATLAGRAGYQLDWSGTWELVTGMPAGELERADPAPLKVTVSFELPAPTRVERLLTTGFGLSRPAVRGMVYSGRIRLPMAIGAKAREDFTIFVFTTPPPSRDPADPVHYRGRRTRGGRLVRVPGGRRRLVLGGGARFPHGSRKTAGSGWPLIAGTTGCRPGRRSRMMRRRFG